MSDKPVSSRKQQALETKTRPNSDNKCDSHGLA